jgi:hypothetical protein
MNWIRLIKALALAFGFISCMSLFIYLLMRFQLTDYLLWGMIILILTGSFYTLLEDGEGENDE